MTGTPRPGDDRVDWGRLEPRIAAFERALAAGAPAPLEAALEGLDPAERAAILPELRLAQAELARAEPGANPVATPEPPAATRRVGRFRLHEELGRGAFGVVFRATDATLGRVVAVKLLRTGRFADPEEVGRFLDEGRHAAVLDHPGIVRVLEVGVADGLPYLVSEYVPGGRTLDDDAPARRDLLRAATLVRGVAAALEAAHAIGLVHRDVKPSNILIDPEGRPRLADFGLARDGDAPRRRTTPGACPGTPTYMSPEGASGKPVDRRSDVYSLGCVLYELIAGEPPFLGSDRMVLLQRLEHDPRPPRHLRPAIPRDLERVCLKALAREPNRRYATAGALAADLGRFLEGLPVQARPLGPAARAARFVRRHPGASVATLLAVGIVTGLWLRAESYRAATEASLREVGRQRVVAVQNLRQAHALLSALIRLEDPALSGAAAGAPREAHLRLSLDQARRFLFGPGFASDPALADERSLAASLIGSLAERLEPPGRAAGAWQVAIRLTEPLAAARPEDADVQFRMAAARFGLARALRALGQTDAAEPHLRGAVAAGDAVLRSPGSSRPEQAWTWNAVASHAYALADLLRERGRAAEAVAAFETTVAIADRTLASDPGVLPCRVTLGSALHELGNLLRREGRPEAARAACERALATWTALARDPAVDVGTVRLRLAQCTFLRGALAYDAERFAEALVDFRDAERGLSAWLATRDAAHESTWDHLLASCHHNQGRCLAALGRPGEAVPAYRRALEIRGRLVAAAADDPSRLSDQGGTAARLADALGALGRTGEAVEACRLAVSLQRRAVELSPGNGRYRGLLDDHLVLSSRLAAVAPAPERRGSAASPGAGRSVAGQGADGDFLEGDDRVLVVVLEADVALRRPGPPRGVALAGPRLGVGLERGGVEGGDGRAVDHGGNPVPLERDLQGVPLHRLAGLGLRLGEGVDRAGAAGRLAAVGDLDLEAVVHGEPGVGRAVGDADVDARVRPRRAGAIDDAQDAVAQRLAGIPEQAHAALGAEHPVLDDEAAGADVLPAVEALAVEQRPRLLGGGRRAESRAQEDGHGQGQAHGGGDVPGAAGHRGASIEIRVGARAHEPTAPGRRAQSPSVVPAGGGGGRRRVEDGRDGVVVGRGPAVLRGAVDGRLADLPVAGAGDPVDAAASGRAGAEAGEGALGVARLGVGDAEGVDHRRRPAVVRAEQGRVGGAGLGGVEVARDDEATARAQLAQLAADQPGGLAAGLRPAVVEVRVEEEDRRAVRGGPVPQLHPGRDPRQRGVPAPGARPVGGLAQPEVAAVELLEPRGAVEQGGHLARLPAVVAAGGERLVAGEPPGDRVALARQRLLRAEQVGVERGDRREQELPPQRPGVGAVRRGPEADVVAHHPHGPGRRGVRLKRRAGGQHHCE
jgi:tetratricopeptide (TPR) repeat protein